MAKKESRGRQKIKMERIKNPNHRQVTFSKRRLGLFKKASEICTLCGVETFIIVFSPGQKIFSFGYPDVESLVNRFLARTTSHQKSANNPIKSEGVPQGYTLRELNSQLTNISDLLEVERNKGELLNTIRKSSQARRWWEAPINNLGMEELEVLNVSLEDLKNNIANYALFLEKNNSPLTLSMDNYNDLGVSQHFNFQSSTIF